MNLSKFYLILLSTIYLVGCSTKKNTLTNRLFHSLTAKDNILYNGEQAFTKANQERILTYRDDFSEILPIEAVKDQSFRPIETGAPLFHLAEKKAHKAIRDHSMYIKGIEYNPYIANAYILLGKAYYYEGRFREALEILDHVVDHYVLSKKTYQARIWREKARMQLGYYASVLFNYGVLRRLETFMNNQDRSDSYAMLAQTNILLDQNDEAIPVLKKAIDLTKNKKIKGRYWFIIGQLYEARRDYSNMLHAYNKVIKLKRRTKWDYYVHAMLKKISYAELTQNDIKPLKSLKKLIKNDYENEDFYNYIYFATAGYYESIDSIEQAKTYYKKTVDAQVSSPDLNLIGKAYQALGDLLFQEEDFINANKSYLDALSFYDKKDKAYQTVSLKYQRLKRVIELEKQLQALDPSGQTILVQATSEPIEEEKIKQNKQTKTTEKQASFYFATQPSILEKGAKKFKKIWGDRALVDNWRYVATVFSDTTIREVIVYDLDTLPSSQPDSSLQIAYTNQMLKLSASEQEDTSQTSLYRDRAYYRLGLIYYEHLASPKLAIKRLERLVDVSQNRDYLLPAYYLLFRAYYKTGQFAPSERYKEIILKNHSKSIYASMVLQPEGSLSNAPATRTYTIAYNHYKKGAYNKAYKQCHNFITETFYHPALSKFRLLAALASYKMGHITEASDLFSQLKAEFPGSQEAKKAGQLLKMIKVDEPDAETPESDPA